MIPTEPLYKSSNGMVFNDNGYVSTGVHKDLNSTTAEILMKKSILNNHLIKRHVLLSNKTEYVNGKCTNTGYAWTNAYCTLMSAGQVTGTFSSNANKYDDGEANYKLPLFNYETWSFDAWAWLRGLYGVSGVGNNFSVYGLTTSGDSYYHYCGVSHGLRPLIYIR